MNTAAMARNKKSRKSPSSDNVDCANSVPEWAKDLREKMEQLTNENELLRKELFQLKDEKEGLADQVYDLEMELYKLAQYGRKENLQIRGIPSQITQKDLEGYVINLLDKVGVRVESYQIAACHRLYQKNKKYPADTIIRFVNRKDAVKAKKNGF